MDSLTFIGVIGSEFMMCPLESLDIALTMQVDSRGTCKCFKLLIFL